jgi:ADP-ribosyl-[dinitrogen reductase] hydrolase
MHCPLLTVDRFRGCLLGLAVGDAVGTTVEFERPGTFPEVADMLGGGPFGLAPGQWTDDTSMALCLADSLLEAGGFDPWDQLERYVRWYRTGYRSSTGAHFDIGNTTRDALLRFERSGEPWCGSEDDQAAGNGSIVRLAPVPMRYLATPVRAIELAAGSSRTTHGALVAVDACRYLAALIVGALGGATKEELLAERYAPAPGVWNARPLCSEVDEVAAGSFGGRGPFRGSGYARDCLEAALWAFATTDSFRDGCLRAVNLGDDADTTAAVYGQLAGAFYGELGIPPEWRARVTFGGEIGQIAEDLCEAATGPRPTPIPDSYWVSDTLIAGEYPGAKSAQLARPRVRRMLAAGVETFVDLTEAGEWQARGAVEPYEPLVVEAASELGRDLRYHRVAIRDIDVPSLEAMAEILDLIDGETAAGRTVYVHCYGGVGRTATVVGAHLVRGGASGDDALDRVQALRARTPKANRPSPETTAQRALVREWRG